MSKIVYIAAGHGGPKDPGAVSNGIIEKDINLKVALFVRDFLFDYQCTVLMSRTSDNPAPTIAQRTADAKAKKADCFISIHHNAGGGIGGEAFFWHTHAPSKALAELVAKEFSKIGQRLRSAAGYPQGTKPSGAKGFRDFGVCRINASNGIPAILGEFAFIDNATDRAKIDTDAKLKKEAEAYGKAVIAFLGLKPKSTSIPITKKYTVVTDINGYRTADDAKNRRNQASRVFAGEYFVYREYGGMVNVTKVSGSPGSWINPNDNIKPIVPLKQIVRVNAVWVSIRERPNSSPIIAKAYYNERFELLGRGTDSKKREWYKIKRRNVTGYVAAWLCKIV